MRSRGRALVTLKDAADYIMALPEAEQNQDKWQTAVACLIGAAEGRDFLMHARIGVLRALNEYDAKAVSVPRKAGQGLQDRSVKSKQPVNRRDKRSNSRIATLHCATVDTVDSRESQAMAVWELYSKRRKKELGQLPDVFTYDSIPTALRTQVVHMWDEAIGVPYRSGKTGHTEKIQDTYFDIAQILRREYGVFKLSTSRDPDDRREAREDLVNWFLKEQDNERVLDAIELTFRIIEVYCGDSNYLYGRKNLAIAEGVVEELNTRFKEHGVGYQFTEGRLLRVDSQLVHAEVVIPALAVLRGEHFAGAQEEFLSAFEHYRHGKKEEALVDACKSFESTMKAICDKRGWTYDKNKASASDLVNICLSQGLIPSFWQGHFAALRTVLQSGIPTARNRQAGHGSGTEARPEPPDELVGYVLHMTASTILFLSEAEKRL